MRHLLVSYHTCPFEEPGVGLSGGMNVYLRGFLPGLARRGIETSVLTRGTGTSVEVTEPAPGVRVFHVPCGWTMPPDRAAALGALPRFTANAREVLRAFPGPPGAVSAHYWMSGVAARELFSGPLFFAYHTVEARKAAGPDGPVSDALSSARRTAERELAERSDAIVFLSGEDLAETRKVFPSIGGKGVVIPPGVDDAFRHPPSRTASRKALGIPAKAFVFLLAARDDPGKNVAEAVDAFVRLRADGRGNEPVLVIAGPRPRRGGDTAQTIFTGPVPHARMPAVYAAADAVVCPSRYESFGLVPLEAMAAGIPVIVPDTGYWGREVAARGGGIPFAAARPDGLLLAMRAALSHGALRARLGDEGRRTAAAFTWETCTDAWARLLATASTRGNPRRIPRVPAAPRRRGPGRAGAS